MKEVFSLKLKWKSGLLLLVGVMLLMALTACSQGKFSEAEEKEFLDDYIDKAMEPIEPTELKALLDDNIEKLSQDGATDAVDGLLYNIYQKMSELNKNAQGFQMKFYNYEEEGVDFNNPEHLSNIEDTVLRTLIEEVQKNFLQIKKENDIYTILPNIDFVLEAYEEYIRDDLKAMIEFSKDEYERTILKENNEFDLDLIAERILLLENNINKFKDSSYTSSFKDAKSYYYQVYFGVIHDYFKNSDNSLVEEVVSHYEKTAKEHGDTQFGKDTQSVLDKLKESNNVLTENVLAYLLELTEYETMDFSSEEGADQEVLDAINEAIEKNSNKKSEEKSEE